VAKAFDLVHKIIDNDKAESRIPFEDQDKPQDEKPKKRFKIEVAFFYVLLFIVFFVMGSTFLAPSIFGGIQKTAEPSPGASPSAGPQQGLVIEKEGKSVEEAAKELQVPNPSPSAVAAVPSAVQEKPATTTSAAAKIQIQNGTNRTGAAAALRTKLADSEIVVASIGNYKSRTVNNTTVFYRPEYETVAKQVQAITGGILADTTDGIGSYDILVVIGAK